MTEIHSSAVVDPKAELGEGVIIGPFCLIGPQVKLGANIKLHSHVVVEGLTEIGAETEIYPFASIGHIPQDKKFSGENSKLIIGSHNRIREHVTMNPRHGRWRDGDDGWLARSVYGGFAYCS